MGCAPSFVMSSLLLLKVCLYRFRPEPGNTSYLWVAGTKRQAPAAQRSSCPTITGGRIDNAVSHKICSSMGFELRAGAKRGPLESAQLEETALWFHLGMALPRRRRPREVAVIGGFSTRPKALGSRRIPGWIVIVRPKITGHQLVCDLLDFLSS